MQVLTGWAIKILNQIGLGCIAMKINYVLFDGAFLLYISSIALVSIFLNADSIHYEALAIWARVVPISFMVIPLFVHSKFRSFAKIMGWAGIFAFFVIASAVSFPSEDYVLGGLDSGPDSGPKDVSMVNVSVRFFIGLSLTSLLIWAYRRFNASFNSIS